MNATLRASDRVAVVGAIDPDVTTASTVTTGWVSAASFANFMAVIMAGTLGSSATVDAKIEQATDGSGTGAKDVSGTAITQLTDSDMQVVINLAANQLDASNNFTHIRLSVTVGTATSDLGAVLFGLDARYSPASNADAATVAEIVN